VGLYRLTNHAAPSSGDSARNGITQWTGRSTHLKNRPGGGGAAGVGAGHTGGGAAWSWLIDVGTGGMFRILLYLRPARAGLALNGTGLAHAGQRAGGE
jgi:hypothetical protein